VRAVLVFESFNLDLSAEFAAEIQAAQFKSAKSLNLISTYIEVAQKFGVDGLAFFARYESDEF
jgi:hypothetical protein